LGACATEGARAITLALSFPIIHTTHSRKPKGAYLAILIVPVACMVIRERWPEWSCGTHREDVMEKLAKRLIDGG
jgi:hypothetical protein